MMPRRRKRNLIIGTIIVIFLIIISIFVVLYMQTDSFKPNSELFIKYISKNFTQLNELKIDELYNKAKEDRQNLDENKYISIINGNLAHSDTNNKVNNVSLEIKSQNDNKSLYTYKEVKIDKDSKNLLGFEYLSNDNNPSIRLKGIKQYVEMQSEELIDMNKNFQNIDLNTFMIKEELYEILSFTNDELSVLRNRYLGIINQDISEKDFSKQNNAIITIDGKQIVTNAYSMKNSKEKMNNLQIKLLEKLKEDEIILEKIDKIENKLVEKNVNVNKLKDKFIQIIDDKIQEIAGNNIGQEERKITVYESNERTVRTIIETEDGAIYVDFINDDSGKILEIRNIKKTEKENSNLFRIKNDEQLNEIVIDLDSVKEGQEKNIELKVETKSEESKFLNNIDLRLYNKDINFTINLKERVNILEKFTNIKQLSEDDKKDLEEENKENAKRIKEILKNNIDEQIKEIQKNVSEEDIKNILIELKFLKDKAETINEEEITEVQKNRFNATFEFYQGDEIAKEDVKQLIEVAKEHLKNAQIAEYKERRRESDPKEPKKYKLTIEKDKKNEKLAEKLLELIEIEKGKSYKVEFEFDENTQMIKNIWITLNEK